MSPNNVEINTVKSSGSLARGSFDARRSICPHRPERRKKKSSIYWLKALPVLILGSSGVQDGLAPPQVIASYLRLKSAALRNTNFSFLQLRSSKTVEGHWNAALRNPALFLGDGQTCSNIPFNGNKKWFVFRVESVQNAERIHEEKQVLIGRFGKWRRQLETGDTVVTHWKWQPRRLTSHKGGGKVYHFALLDWWRQILGGRAVQHFLTLHYQSNSHQREPNISSKGLEDLRKSLSVDELDL